jgi:PAS domain S-box-containing protein
MPDESNVYRILIADDEEPNLKLFHDIVHLEFGGIMESETAKPPEKSPKSYDVVLCTQADEAVALFEEGLRENKPFSIAFLDVRMPPGPDGIWAAQKIRAMDNQVEIVVVTGFADYHPKEISSRIPPPHKLLYMNKPYRINEIFQTISCLSSKWENERELLAIKKDLESRIAERTQELAQVNEELKKDIEIRKEAENALRQSEERYRILTSSMADGVAIIQDGQVIFFNPAFAEMIEYTAREKNPVIEIYNIIDKESHKEVTAFFQELQNGSTEKGSLQFPCRTFSGRDFWMECHFNVIQWEDSRAILATSQDITEQKNREIAMETAANKYKKQLNRLQSSLKDRYRFRDIIGKSSAIQEVYEMILSAGASDASVVIYGESGTGKELIAKSIHEISDRRAEKFVPVNCGAVPEALFESEFFGHKKGAFTGATTDHPGFFDQAKGGTLFLDEVGELNLNMQVKMLRAIEGGGFTPVGGTMPKKADVRIISATNRDLQQGIKKKEMRADFFYRLNVVPINVPPLRDRREDIPLLVEYYLEKFGKDKGKQTIPGKIMDALCRYDWPGNIRQLQNVLQRYITLNKFEFSEILEDFSADSPLACGVSESEMADFKTAVQELEKRLINKALEKTQWHKANAAEILGMPRRTLFRKIKEYGL